MHAQRDPCVEHGIDVEVVTVELSLQPDGAADAHAADQPSNSIAEDVGAIEGFFNEAWIAGPRGTSRTVVHSGRSTPCARSHSGYFATTMPRWSGATGRARPTLLLSSSTSGSREPRSGSSRRSTRTASTARSRGSPEEGAS